MSLVERSGQIDRLRAMLAAAAGGRGQVLAIAGEAGVGKSALVRAFAEIAGASARVLWGTCEDMAAPDPLGPVQELARAAGWDLEAKIRQGGRLAAFVQARETFDAAGIATLLIVEDLHWADDATIDFVRFLGRRIRDCRILLLATMRSDEPEARSRIRRALADIPADDVARMELPPLSEAAVASLACATGLDAGAIYRLSAGNAFYVTELIRTGGGTQLSASVSDAVLMRADRLAPALRQILDAAAIFPRRVEISLLREVAGRDCRSEIEQCATLGMLTMEGDACAFRHEIARRVVEAALPASERRDLNTRALAALRAGPAAMARLVHHAHAAGDSAAVRIYAWAAAEEASRLGAHREAADHLRTALAHVNRFDLGERLALHGRYAFECHLIGRMKEAIAAQKAALDLHRAGGDRMQEGDSLRWLSRLSYLAGNRIDADRFAREAVEILEPLGPGPELAMAWSNLSQLAMLASRSEEALAYGRMALALAGPDALDRRDILCHALNNVGSAAHWRDAGEARSLLDRSLSIARADDFAEHAARTYTNRGWLEFQQLSDDVARLWLEAGIHYCIERDLDTWRDYMRGYLADVHLRQGRWEEAAEIAHLVLANDEAAPLARYPALLVLARLRTRRGDPAGELLVELERFLETGIELQRLAPYATLMAERAWLGCADRERALALLDHAAALAPDARIIPEIHHWWRMLGAEHDEPASGMAKPYRLLFAGEWRAAACTWRELGMPYEQALALQEGDASALGEALDIVRRLGARAALDRLRDLARRRGVRVPASGPRPSTRANPAGLTKRQMDVLRLIDEGRSNGEIALALFVSSKTIDHHISAILGKLNARSRGEAAAVARNAGLIGK